jgi:ribulose-phosphate 3-epimerase
MKILAPSILSADFSELGKAAQDVSDGGAGLLHVDVMDGHFVPNISFGAPVMKSLVGKADLPFDVHLMIEDPDKYIDDFVTDNTRYITVHQEACTHLHRTLQHIQSTGVKRGVSLNPATPLCMIEDVLDDIDMVLIMSVNPGFGGQKLIPHALEKIRTLDKIRKERGHNFLIEIDGGVTIDNVRTVCDAGTDIIVAGSAVYGAPDVTARTKEFVEILNK